MKLAPSILSADFADLASQVKLVEPAADLLHVDVMDGHFVPVLTIGPTVVKSLRKHTNLFLHCHLMVNNPEVLLEEFAEAGANQCTIHIELGDPRPNFKRMRDLGMQVGLTLNPPTPFGEVEPYLGEIDKLLVMSVNPGWGGQKFIPDALDKVHAARKIIDDNNLGCEIEIDGGINLETAPAAVDAGVDILAAGSAIFHAPDPLKAAQDLKALGH